MVQAAPNPPELRDLTVLKAAIDAHAIVAITDADGVITYVNQKFCDISGYTCQELIGSTHGIVNSGTHPCEFFKNLWLTIKSGSTWKGEICNRRKDGTLYWVDTVIVPMDMQDGRPGQYVSIRTDITQRKEAEHARHIAQEREYRLLDERLRAIWEYEPQFVCITDADMVVQDINPAGLALLRMPALPPGSRVVDFIHPDDRAQYLSAHARALGGERIVQRARLADPFQTPVEQRLVALRSGPADAGSVLNVFADIASQALVEQKLRQHQEELEARVRERTAALMAANEDLEAFAAVVSHDLRAPLALIASFSEVIASEAGARLDPRSADALDRIQRGVRRMKEMIQALLSLSSVVQGDMQRSEVDLSHMAAQIMDELRAGDPDRPISFTIQPGLRAFGDSHLLYQVLENLLGNAWKFTRGREPARIAFGAAVPPDGRETAFYVRDNGAGFDPRYAERLFHAFQRLHSASEFPGTGMGLATVQRIVRRHGGTVWAQSRPDEGAQFWFRL